MPCPGAIASSSPSPVRASVRAMISVSDRVRAFKRDLDLAAHVAGRDHAPVRGVAAFLRHLLILDLDRLHPGGLVAAHGLAHVDQPAETGIGVRDQRRLDRRGDGAGPVDHVAIGDEPGIGHAEVRARYAIAGHVQRLEADAVGNPGREHLEDAGSQDELALREQGLEADGGHARDILKRVRRRDAACDRGRGERRRLWWRA